VKFRTLRWLLFFFVLVLIVAQVVAITYLDNSTTWVGDIIPVEHGPLALGDVDNDGDLDLVGMGCDTYDVSGCISTYAEIYLNNGENFTSSQAWGSNLTELHYGAFVWGDVNNDGWLDLFTMGCNLGGAYGDSCAVGSAKSLVYLNNGSTLIENSSWQNNITGVWRGSAAFGDLDLDGDLDLAITGIETGLPTLLTQVYLNNGTGFEESSTWEENLTALDRSALALGDFDNDNDLDLALSGRLLGGTKFTEIYINNGSTLLPSSAWSQNIVNVDDGSFALGDYNNDGNLDMAIIGCCDHLETHINNGSTFVLDAKDGHFTGVFAGSVTFGDYDNDGDLDMIASGREEETWFHLYDGTNFTASPLTPEPQLETLEYSYQTFGDVDLDGDLDLIMTGRSDGSVQKSFVYINNITTVNNTVPDAPAVASLSASYADGQLILSWDNASDNQTPTAGLYYNLRVGTTPGGHEIVTGVYGGGDDNGYMGNMMQRRQITLDVTLNANDSVYWAVQTIDTGLSAGNWTVEQNFTVLDLAPPSWSANWSSTPTTYAPTTLSIFNVTWSENMNFSNAWLESNYSGSAQTYAMNNLTDTVYNYSAVLPAGSHYWIGHANDTAGNTNSSDTYYFTIARAAPTLNLTLNGTEANFTLNESEALWLNGTLITGDGGTELTLYSNGAELASETTVGNLTNFTLPQVYNITLTYTQTENYSAASATYWLTVNDLTAPVVQSYSPIVTVTTSSTTLSATTNENATCRYSTTAGTAYVSMVGVMVGVAVSHTADLTGLATGTYHYYIRCNNTVGLVASTDYDASFTVSISTGGGGGGGGGAPATDPNTKQTTFSSLTPDKEHRLYVDRSTIAATKVGFVNTVQAMNVKLSVSTVNDSDLTDRPEKAYDYFNVTLEGLYAHELSEAWLEFKVNSSWITDNGATKDDVRLKRQKATWQELDTLWMKDSGQYSYFNATSPGFSIFAIALVTAKEPEPEPEPEPNAMIEPEPEVNQTVEPPIKPPERSRVLLWLTLLVLIALTAAGTIYLKKRGALRSE